MALLQEADRIEIKKRLDDMKGDVSIVYFTQDMECNYCRETHQLLEELAGLNAKLRLQVFDFMKEKQEAEKYRIDKIPATVIRNGKDHGIRYYGIPSGYEFASLLEDLIMVSEGRSGLSEKAKKLLKGVTEPVHIQVFVTPT